MLDHLKVNTCQHSVVSITTPSFNQINVDVLKKKFYQINGLFCRNTSKRLLGIASPLLRGIRLYNYIPRLQADQVSGVLSDDKHALTQPLTNRDEKPLTAFIADITFIY